MRVVINKKKVARNKQIAQYAFFITLAFLILGLFVTNAAPTNPLLFFAPLVVLPVALAATIFSVRMANLWLREPRPENVFDQNLKGLSSRSVLYHYLLPARHVLVTPHGVFAFAIRQQEGDFVINGSKWQKKGGALSKFLTFFRQDNVGRPDLDVQDEVARAQKFIDEIAPDSKVQVEPVIVFTSPLANLEIVESAIPIYNADPKQKPNLKTFIKEIKGRENPVTLNAEQIKALDEALEITKEHEL
jgi:hypothetical protein